MKPTPTLQFRRAPAGFDGFDIWQGGQQVGTLRFGQAEPGALAAWLIELDGHPRGVCCYESEARRQVRATLAAPP